MKHNVLWAVIIVAVVAGLIYFLAAYNGTQAPSSQSETTQESNTINTTTTKNTPMEGLTIEDIKTGTGAEAVAGDMVEVNYTGTLTNGTKFDSSLDRHQTFSFALGAGQVIKGWDLGVAGMKVGGTRKLTIAPELAYGAQAVGPIPPNSTLIFTVDLVSIKGK